MEIASVGRLTDGPKATSANRRVGFSLLEMMMVVTVILIIASFATPIYMACIIRVCTGQQPTNRNDSGGRRHPRAGGGARCAEELDSRLRGNDVTFDGAREAVLRDDLFTLRALIDQFTRDNGRATLLSETP